MMSPAGGQGNENTFSGPILVVRRKAKRYADRVELAFWHPQDYITPPEGVAVMPIDPKLLEILACPLCKSKVFETDESIYCTNKECRRRYAITDGIPVMLIDEATILEPAEWDQAMTKRSD